MTQLLEGAEGLASPDGQAIRRVIETFVAAFGRGDVEAIRPLFTPDAIVYPSNDRDRVGWADIADYWAPPFRSLDIALVVDLRAVAVSGDLAVAEMTTRARVRPKAGGDEVRRQYRDMVVLRRGPDGWQIHRNLSQAWPDAADA